MGIDGGSPYDRNDISCDKPDKKGGKAMAEHFCKIHEVKFFKTAKMRGFAHPIEGTEPTRWCAEEDMESYHSPDPEIEKVVQKKLKEESPESNEAVKVKPAPQELGMWWKELGEMIRAKEIDMTKPAGKLMRTAYYAQMMSVLDIKIEDK